MCGTMGKYARSACLPLLAAGFATFAALWALDRGIAWSDLDYGAARGRPNEERWLETHEFKVLVRTNALGFREPRLPKTKPPGVVRVVALGDSFTQGYGVAEDDAYPRQLEQRLSARSDRYEVVNLGLPGTNPRDYLGHLRDPGLRYDPDVVLVGVMANDVQDILMQRRLGVQYAGEALRDVQRDVRHPRAWWRRAPSAVFPALYPFVWERLASLRGALGRSTADAADAPAPRARAGSAPLATPWQEVVQRLGDRMGRSRETTAALAAVSPADAASIAPVATGAISLESESAMEGYQRLMALVQPRLYADAVLLPDDYDAAWRTTERYLDAIARVAHGAGARVVLVYVPASHQVNPQVRRVYEARGFEWDERTLVDTTLSDRLRAFANERELDLVDLLPVLRERRDPTLYFPADGHWTPAGHAVAADAIAAAIDR